MANQAMDQAPHRAALASLSALVIASRWADQIGATGLEVRKCEGLQGWSLWGGF